jgi:endonuclease-8
LVADDWEYVCFNAKAVEWLMESGFRLADQRARLGPDLISEAVDVPALLERVRSLHTAETRLVDLLLDQRVAAGIGNVYKSELLFLGGYWPLTALGALSDTDLSALYVEASRLLRANLGGGPRTTRATTDGRGPLWVYGRLGQACLRCRDARIRRAPFGLQPRSTYWCPTCQPSGEHTRSARSHSADGADCLTPDGRVDDKPDDQPNGEQDNETSR